MCCLAMRRRKVKRMANGEWRMGVGYGARPNHVLSRSGSLAGCHGLGGGLFSGYQIISKIRIIRLNVANQAIRQLNSGKYCRGTWSRNHCLVHSFLPDCARVFEGIGNAFDTFKSRAINHGRPSQKAYCRLRVSWKNGAWNDKIIACSTVIPLATRHSLFAIRYSLFASFRGLHA